MKEICDIVNLKDVLKNPSLGIKARKLSSTEVKYIVEKTVQAQKKILDLKNLDYQKLENAYVNL